MSLSRSVASSLAGAGVASAAVLLARRCLRERDDAIHRAHSSKNIEVSFSRRGVREYTVLVSRTAEECAASVATLCATLNLSTPQCHAVIGMDCEWETGGTVATLQLSSHDTVVVLQLQHILAETTHHSEHLTPLVNLLRDRRVFKVGAAVGGDAKKLLKDHNLAVSHWVCVQKMASFFGFIRQDKDEDQCGPDASHLPAVKGYSLGHLTEGICGVLLDKQSSSAQCSLWGRRTLTENQVHYAALDAVASREVAVEMIVLVESAKTARSSSSTAEAAARHPQARHLASLAEMNFSKKNKQTKKGAPPPPPPKKKHQFADTLKKPLYTNCLILAPDNEELVCTDEKKAMWYVSKGRAELVSKEPRLTIRLLFEPIGRNTRATVIENRCVVCGTEEHLLKHHVVPHCFRREFPRHRKIHQHHDVVLSCKPCATICQHHYSRFTSELEATHNVNGADTHKHLRTAASAILNLLKDVKWDANVAVSFPDVADLPEKYRRKCLPEKRFDELLTVCREHLERDGDVFLSDLEEMVSSLAQIPASQKLVHKFQRELGDEEGVTQIVRSWRRCFVDAMQPGFLPEHWSVDAVHVDVRALHGLPPPEGALLGNDPCFLEEKPKWVEPKEGSSS